MRSEKLSKDKACMSKTCAECDTGTTPQWRGDLCNACGIRAATNNKRTNGGGARKRQSFGRLATKQDAATESTAPPHILLPRCIMHTLSNTDVKSAYAQLLRICK